MKSLFALFITAMAIVPITSMIVDHQLPEKPQKIYYVVVGHHEHP